MNNNIIKFGNVRHSIVIFALVALLIFAGQSSVQAQTQFSELTKVNLKSGSYGAQLGYSVSIDGNTMISGAPEFSLTQTQSGRRSIRLRSQRERRVGFAAAIDSQHTRAELQIRNLR